jgi:superfamily II RNA helicase
MSGRAGRRGLDQTGKVIIATNSEIPDVSSVCRIIIDISFIFTLYLSKRRLHSIR